MTRNILASLMLLAGLTGSGCDKTALNFEPVAYEVFDLGGIDGSTFCLANESAEGVESPVRNIAALKPTPVVAH